MHNKCQILGLVAGYWQADLVPRVWLQGPGIPKSCPILVGVPVLDTVAYRIHGVLKVMLAWQWVGPGPRRSQDRSSPHCQSYFSCSLACLLVVEAGLETSVGFLAGGASVRPLVGGAGSWLTGGQGPCVGAHLGAGVGPLVCRLSAARGDWVLTHSVVQTAVTQHGHLKAVQWDPGLGAKC